MAVEAERLLAVFEARFASFEKAVAKARGDATKAFSDIESAGSKAERGLSRIGSGSSSGLGGLERAARGARVETGNLAAQINDIGVQLAGGQSPFLIAIQQGTQIQQALGSGGAGAAVKALGGAFASLVNPVGIATIATIGLAGAAVQYFAEWVSGGERTSKEIEEQAALIQRVADRLGSSVPVIRQFADEMKRAGENTETLQALENIKTDTLEKLREDFDKLTEEQGANISLVVDANREYGVLASMIASNSQTAEDFQRVIDALNAALKVHANAGLEAAVRALEEMRDASDRAATTLEEVRVAQAKVTLTTEEMNDRLAITASAMAGLGGTGVDAIKSVAGSIAEDLIPNITKAIDGLMTMAENLSHLQKQTNFSNPLGALPPLESNNGQFMDPAQAQEYRANNTPSQFQRELADASGAINAFVENVVRAESGGKADAKNPNSSATGLGQFIESTWLGLFRKYYPEQAASMSRDAILGLRKDATASRTLIAAYARENAQVLQRAGVHVDEAALQLAHFLGAGDAAKVLRAAPGTPLAGLISQSSINANPTILGGGRTVEDAIAYGQRRAQAPVGGYGDASTGRRTRTPEQIFEGRVEDVQKRIDVLNAELAAQKGLTQGVNDYGFAVEQAKIKADLLNEAKQAGLTITPELAARIDQLATNYAKLSAQQEQTKASQEAFNQTAQEFAALGKDVLGGFISDLRAGKSASEALANALNKVADRLLDMALNAIFSPAGGGGIGGFLSSIFGGGKAKGGPVSPNKAYVVGEKGPELFSPGRSGMITPNNMLAGPPPSPVQRRASASQPISITLAPVIDNRGASVEAVARTQAQLDKLEQNLPAHVIKAVRQANNSRVKLT